jgi:hypothetical protein
VNNINVLNYLADDLLEEAYSLIDISNKHREESLLESSYSKLREAVIYEKIANMIYSAILKDDGN